jgi:hypothetical protein
MSSGNHAFIQILNSYHLFCIAYLVLEIWFLEFRVWNLVLGISFFELGS